MCLVYDNPRTSELLNHLGSQAIKYCNLCIVSQNDCSIYFIGKLKLWVINQTARMENPLHSVRIEKKGYDAAAECSNKNTADRY